MENMINSEIALLVLAICSVILTIALLILIWRVVRLLKSVEEVTKATDEILEKVKDEVELASLDIERLRERLHRDSLGAVSIIKYVSSLLKKKKGKSRKV